MEVPEKPGLYVHVPFCRTRCPYCAFRSTVETSRIDDWLDALEKEAGRYPNWSDPFDTLYIGGGTPSVLPEPALNRMMGILLGSFAFSEGLEATIEVNPGDVNDDRTGLLVGLGFNRVSIGVQSFVQQELEFLGRRHNAARAVHSMETFRNAGVKSIGLDLMQGMPGQTMTSRLESLERAVSLRPEHLSCYELEFAPGTPFEEARSAGSLMKMDEATAADGFIATSVFLEEQGYIQYEVSNYSRGGSHRSRHNGKYWTHVPTLGLGPSAHSFDGDRRWRNVNQLGEYCSRLRSGREPVTDSEILIPEQLRLERLALGFRTREGVDRADLGDTREAASLLERLRAEGLVTIDGVRVLPTREGFRVADGLARGFM